MPPTAITWFSDEGHWGAEGIALSPLIASQSYMPLSPVAVEGDHTEMIEREENDAG